MNLSHVFNWIWSFSSISLSVYIVRRSVSTELLFESIFIPTKEIFINVFVTFDSYISTQPFMTAKRSSNVVRFKHMFSWFFRVKNLRKPANSNSFWMTSCQIYHRRSVYLLNLVQKHCNKATLEYFARTFWQLVQHAAICGNEFDSFQDTLSKVHTWFSVNQAHVLHQYRSKVVQIHQECNTTWNFSRFPSAFPFRRTSKNATL